MKRNWKKNLAAVLLLSLLSGCLPAGASADKVLTWPSGVKIVGEQMFYGDTSIETVILPENVEGIGSQAFANSSLKAIHLPSTLDMDQVAEDAFGGIRPIVRAPKECEAYQWARDQGLLAEYRALVIGEKSFPEIANRNAEDANKMEAMLNKVSGFTGVEDHFTVRKEIDLSAEGIRSAIETTFAETKPQDVSLFFIATHGILDQTGRKGDLEMPNGGGYLPLATLANWLTIYVQGKVIVILQSCFAGYAIYDPEIAENSSEGNSLQIMGNAKSGSSFSQEQDFAELAVQVFAEKDPGVIIMPGPEGEAGGLRKNSGEMRVENKFYVLAASRHNEMNYGYEESGHGFIGNFFTKWLLEGIGTKKNSPADISPKDGALTLKELFDHVNTHVYAANNSNYPQHVQCYPSDCNFVCFLLR